MILRIDRLQAELPGPSTPDPAGAAAVQELMGGKFGEMSTLMNYTFQSFNFRGRDRARPFYDLIANIAAEEYGHIELVAYTINLLLTGATERGDDPTSARTPPSRNHIIIGGQSALPVDSHGQPLERDQRASPAATSSSTCCTTSSWSAAPAPTRSASTR